jgi:hypothetical protein
MLKKEILFLTLILACAMLSTPMLIWAQDAASTKPQTENSAEEKPKDDNAKSRPPIGQYHLDISIHELEDGKKVNSRQYSLDLDSNDSNEVKIGTRVPVEVKEGELQYLDVGTSIFARIGEKRDQTELSVRVENSSFAMDSNSQDPRAQHENLHPAIRQLKMGGTVLLPLTRPVIIATAADPNSRREYQLEVTVTKAR